MGFSESLSLPKGTLLSGENPLHDYVLTDIMCVVFPSGLPGGMLGLEGFVVNLFICEPGSAQEV
jgi:hypothetical protein